MTRELWTKSGNSPSAAASCTPDKCTSRPRHDYKSAKRKQKQPLPLAVDDSSPRLPKVDKHQLYELSVQSPRSEVQTLLMFYRQLWHERQLQFKHKHHDGIGENGDDYDESNADRPTPSRLREDFCGTAVVCAEFARRSPLNDSYGVDYDRTTIEYALERTENEPEGQRVHLYCDNVFTCSQTLTPRCDIICALNYGVFYCHQRAQLVSYLRKSRELLRPPAGLFICDVFGGSLCYHDNEGKSSRRPLQADDMNGGQLDFIYHFEQRSFDSLTNRARCFIHFEFPREKCWMRQAFSYDFRIYTICEVREAMAEAGFRRSYVWVSETTVSEKGQDDDENHGGLMTYRRLNDDEHFPGTDYFNAYIVGCI